MTPEFSDAEQLISKQTNTIPINDNTIVSVADLYGDARNIERSDIDEGMNLNQKNELQMIRAKRWRSSCKKNPCTREKDTISMPGGSFFCQRIQDSKTNTGDARSMRKLQREPIVHSDGNSQAGSKNYSFESIKSDNILSHSRTYSSQIEKEPRHSCTTLTVPIQQYGARNLETPDANIPSVHKTSVPLCTICALAPRERNTHADPPNNRFNIRRHSDCCRLVGTEQTSDHVLCRKCNRECSCIKVTTGTRLYPPTRNRNASCSGIDMLAEAIWRAHNKQQSGGQQLQKISLPFIQSTGESTILSRIFRDLRRRPVQQTSSTPTADKEVASSTKVKPPMLITPSVDYEDADDVVENPRLENWQSSSREDKEVDDKWQLEALMRSTSPPRPIENQIGRSCYDMGALNKVRAPDSSALKVPTLPAYVPKRTTTLDDELSLDSRIRRVSMILMNRQQPGDGRTQSAESKDSNTQQQSQSEEDHTSQTSLHRVKIVTPPIEHEDWSAPCVADSKSDGYSIFSTPKATQDSSAYSPLKSSLSAKEREALNRRRFIRRQTERFSKGIGYHLGRRRRLLERRRRMADFSLAFGLFGIVAALLDTEFVARGVYSKSSTYSIGMRILISLSTLFLLVLILSYHAYDVMIFLCEEYIKDWRISVTRRRVVQVCAELFLCSIHPVPGLTLFFHRTVNASSTTMRPEPLAYHSRLYLNPHLDDKFSPYLLLILPMIGRFYLVFRALLLHSRMFNDAGSRSIGAMNKVSFDLRFVLKTLMTVCPLKFLLVFIFTLWLILSWMLRACEIEQGENHLGLLNSAWLISVTFLSIGYGDIVPHTSCGRLVAVTTGLMGSACTALLVAVFSRKLEMSKAEKHVLHFMEVNKITKRVKHCAANVLRETWLLYKHAKLMPSFNPHRVRLHQRKFLQAIYSLRSVKVKQRELQEKADSLIDLAKLQTNVFENVADITLRQDAFQQQLDCIEQHLIELKKLIIENQNHVGQNTLTNLQCSDE